MSTIEQPVAVDGDKLMQFVFRAVDEVGATLNAALVVMGDKLGWYRALAGNGGPSRSRAGRANRLRRALCQGVAERPGGGRLCPLRPGQRPLHAATRADGRADRFEQPRVPARVLPDRARLGPRLARGSPTSRAPATASAGTITFMTYTRGASASSARVTTLTSWPNGCRRSTASSTSSSAGRSSPTSAAATERRRS